MAKTALTPEEKVRVAWAHLANGIDQHQLAAIFGVNQGRVAEAVIAVRAACGYPPRVRTRTPTVAAAAGLFPEEPEVEPEGEPE